MKLSEIEDADQLATKESLANLRADLHRDFGDFRSDMQKALGDFRSDLIKTLWLTQLSVAGVILVGVGILIHVRP